MVNDSRQKFIRHAWRSVGKVGVASWIAVTGFAVAAQAQTSLACIYDSNGPATALVEYKYKADGVERTMFGSGFVVSADGHILTNNHVLRPESSDAKVLSDSVSVRLGTVKAPVIDAVIVRRDQEADLALLKIGKAAMPWPTVKIGSSSKLDVGAPLTALGFSGGDLSVIPTQPITSRNTVISGVLKPWWQTALSVNRGNSGGPVFGNLGTVVGVAVAITSNKQSVNFVIPIQYAASILKEAEVTVERAGPCAELPACRRQEHGVERYALDMMKDGWSGSKPGGHTRQGYCTELLNDLRTAYPNATFAKGRDDEKSNKDLAGHVTYKYYCEYRVMDKPIYKEAKAVECLAP